METNGHSNGRSTGSKFMTVDIKTSCKKTECSTRRTELNKIVFELSQMTAFEREAYLNCVRDPDYSVIRKALSDQNDSGEGAYI